MIFPPSFLEQIRLRLTLSNVVGKYVRLQKRGREYVGLCPFHNEKTPSFHVVEEKEFYHCFGCGAHGDVVSFIMHTEGLTFVEAVEKLASDAGLNIPAPTVEQKKNTHKYFTLYQVCELACQFFQKCLYGSDGTQAFSYIQRRKIEKGICAQFRLGYAPAGKQLI